ncbi:MAG: NAD-dependent epimerase/dehydratase family protein [Bacteroidales bacterium]|nr:NAD-dependent epimerase/dehydratase family protein [Bacteroidales bacterium]
MILVTGGTGLLGSYLLHELTGRGKKVRVLFRPGKHVDELNQVLGCFNASKSQIDLIEWFEGDILDFVSLTEAMKGIEQVYHCAAIISFDPRDLKQMLHTNVDGTANVVNACLQEGVKKLCHVSSIASLGRPEQEGIIDEDAKWKTSRRNSGYAISKYGGEREVWRGIEEGLKAVIVNPSVILGAGCHPKATNRLFHSIEKMIPFYNDGVNGYVDARDVVRAMILLMESDVSGERYVMNAENLSLKELFTMAAEILGKRPPFIPVGRAFFSLAWRVEWLRSRITGQSALITRENTRSARSKSFYSSEKFQKQFNYTFIPIRQSLKDAFLKLGKIESAEKA